MGSYKGDVSFWYFSQEDVRAAGLNMALCCEDVEKFLRILGSEDVVEAPVRVQVQASEQDWLLAHGAYLRGEYNAGCIYSCTTFPGNPHKYGIPRATGLLMLLDPANGTPIALMDNTIMQQMRLGAEVGVAAKYLARRDSQILGVVGAGVQSRMGAMGIREMMPSLKEVWLYARRREAGEEYAGEIARKLGLIVKIADSPREAIEGADIILTATTANEPIVKSEWVGKGVFYTHLGTWQEEEYEVVKRSDKIVVDNWEREKLRQSPTTLKKMYTEGLIKDSDIYGELGEVITGKKPGRESNEERIIFFPAGLPGAAVPIAYDIYQKALQKGIGTKLPLWEEYAIP